MTAAPHAPSIMSATAPASVPTKRTDRLNLRIAPEALDTIRQAAAAQQQDVTSFVLGAAMERAREVLLQDQVLHLSPEGMQQIEAALDAQPREVPELAHLLWEVKGRRATSANMAV